MNFKSNIFALKIPPYNYIYKKVSRLEDCSMVTSRPIPSCLVLFNRLFFHERGFVVSWGRIDKDISAENIRGLTDISGIDKDKI